MNAGRALLGYFFGPKRRDVPSLDDLMSLRPEGVVLLSKFGHLGLTAQDRDAVVALWHEAALTRPWNDPVGDFERPLRDTTSAVLGAFDGADLTAAVMVGHDGHRGWVYYLAVISTRRRAGLGRRMMCEAESWLREQGAVKVNVMIRHGNAEVLGFYDRLGCSDDEVTVRARWLLTCGFTAQRANGTTSRPRPGRREAARFSRHMRSSRPCAMRSSRPSNRCPYRSRVTITELWPCVPGSLSPCFRLLAGDGKGDWCVAGREKPKAIKPRPPGCRQPRRDGSSTFRMGPTDRYEVRPHHPPSCAGKTRPVPGPRSAWLEICSVRACARKAGRLIPDRRRAAVFGGPEPTPSRSARSVAPSPVHRLRRRASRTPPPATPLTG